MPLTGNPSCHLLGEAVANSCASTYFNPAKTANFIREFIRIYKSHGGIVANESPVITGGVKDAAEAVSELHNAIQQKSRFFTQYMDTDLELTSLSWTKAANYDVPSTG